MPDGMQKKYFIQQYIQQEYLHGGIGLTDAERILLSEGYTPILFPHQQNFSLPAKISRLFYLFKIVFQIQTGAEVVFLFPMYAKMVQLLVRLLSLRKNIRLICFITDIDGLRDGDQQKMRKETVQLQRYSFFIVHTQAMGKWIKQLVPDSVFSILEFFDYLANLCSITSLSKYKIIYAGNLAKSNFLEKLYLLKQQSPELQFNLYGSGLSDTARKQGNVKYYGVSAPDVIMSKLKGSFGLVWDGENIDSCTGSYGEYLRYNSQHKLSLYIACTLPVIVWKDAATAILVEKYKIGFAVNNLYEIEERIRSLSEEEYREMQKNMQPLAQKICTGGCLKDALAELTQL